MKACTRCKKSLPDNAFNKNASKPDGLGSECRVCDSERKKARAARYREINRGGGTRAPAMEQRPPSLLEKEPEDFEITTCELPPGVDSFVPMTREVVPPSSIRTLFIPDTHAPYHDKQAFAVMLNAAEHFKPDTIVILGDFQDFYCVSDHDKNPNRVALLDNEIADGNNLLTLIDRLDAKRKVFVCGNHENRLSRYMSRRAPAVSNMLSIQDALKLKERGYEFIQYKDGIQLGSVYVTHDTEHAGKYSLQHSMADVGASFIIGHTHRLGFYLAHDSFGRPAFAASFGWLGDFSKVDYMHALKARRDWSHGFGLGYTVDGYTHVVPVPIIDGKCVVDGKVIRL